MYYIMCSKPRAGYSDCDCLIFNDIMGSMCLISYFTLREKFMKGGALKTCQIQVRLKVIMPH